MNADEMLGIEDGVLILSSSVDNLGQKGLVLVDYFMGEGVLDCWVVGLDKVTFAILDSEGGFTDRARADDGDFALFSMRCHGWARDGKVWLITEFVMSEARNGFCTGMSDRLTRNVYNMVSAR